MRSYKHFQPGMTVDLVSVLEPCVVMLICVCKSAKHLNNPLSGDMHLTHKMHMAIS